ncbi:tRNA uridine(34) 5-carboxymethylaminomethyl modification radical SAM/GNAT enzyme Elp3 [Candidatus Micrarchaeota archaeon]|nr:tRNA uridine(34) 5-carboxymethylaminomethyl modification radical SAM/GNAT enzyme Elp3 [Candidatus Micrarchaeota archaeon]
MKKQAIQYIIGRLISGEKNLRKIKNEAGKKFHLKSLPRNPEILKEFPKRKLTPEIKSLLLKKPMRTLSGVTPVAVMIRPDDSCLWKCIYCPFTGKAAKSYTGEEPAALRARNEGFDPSRQVLSRLRQFRESGHPTDKCEVIVMGGTFLRTPEKYQRNFIKKIYDSMNGKTSRNLADAKKLNEKSKHRIVGLTIETRPDVCSEKDINKMLEYGATRVEIGVQHPDNRIYRIINRGHTVEDVVSATRSLRNAGLKIVYHLMPGLPGSDIKKDKKMIEKIFCDERFKPDMLKIYPTLVLPGTALYRMMQERKYKPLETSKAVEIISEWYGKVPEYVRIMRIQRDIPADLIGEGVKKSNLRQLVEISLKEKGITPAEIRSREAGLRNKILNPENTELRMLEYNAGGGKEFFISCTGPENILAGFIRLRFPSGSFRKEIDKKTALIRELHVYGGEAEIGKKGNVQHKGFGKILLKKAEQTALNNGKDKMCIISGTGVREYYRSFGYVLEGPYMVRQLK